MDNKNIESKEDVTIIFGSKEMREPAASEYIPKHKTPADIAYQMVKDETAKTESGHIRHHLHGRLRHTTYERSRRNKLHRRD